jgi:autotransporter-associated beta strand protein
MGFGSATTGARGGAPAIYQVTTLANSGAGSFRDAVSQPNRIIIFDVGGYIHLSSPISASSNLTILGQTAPGDGIAIFGAETSFYGKSNDICRFVRFLDTSQDPGGTGTGNSSGNCINLGNTSNMIFDHVSCEFAPYNNIDASGTTGAANLTFQNSLVAAPILSQQFNFHWEGDGGSATFINNVFSDAHNRSILDKGNSQFVDNTIYNYQAAFTSGNSSGAFNYDIINNQFITGPSTTSPSDNFYQVDSTQSAYAAGNILDSNKNGALDGSADNSTGSTTLSTPYFNSTASLPQLSTSASYAWNVAHAGDSIVHDPTTYAGSLGYDQVDEYMIGQVQSLGTSGRLYNTERDDGLSNSGLGVVNSGTLPADTIGDGIPDSFKLAHGMSTTTSQALLRDPLGYTMIEDYANQMADQATLTTRTWTAGSGTWTTAANWTGGAAPIIYDIASVQGSGTANGLVTVASSTATAYRLYIGGNGPAAGEKVQVTGGNLRVLDTIFVGNTNNGTLEIDGGSVQAANMQLGSTYYTTTYNGSLLLNGGTLSVQQVVLGGGSPGNWTTGGSISFNGGTLLSSGSLNVNVPGTLGASGGVINTNGFNGVYSGQISGSGMLTKTGAGTLALTATNTCTCITTIRGGVLQIGSLTNGGIAGNLGAASSASANLVLDGGTLQVENASSTDRGLTITANGGTFYDSSASGGATINGAIVASGAGNRVFTYDKAGGSTNTGSIAGAITDSSSGVLSVTKIDSGRLSFLGAAKTYSGDTTIDAGTLLAYATNVMPYGSGKGNLIVAGGATLDASFSENINGLFGAGTVTNNSSSTVTLTLGNGDATSTFSGAVTGPLNITKAGSGTFTLSGSNNYTGVTTVSGGTLQLGSGAANGFDRPHHWIEHRRRRRGGLSPRDE